MTPCVQGFKHAAERRKPGHRDAGALGLLQWLEEKTLQFERLSAFEIDQGRSLVSGHGARAFDLFVGQGIVPVEAERAGSGDHLEH